MSFSSSNYDFLDVIDLDSALKMDSGIGSQGEKGKSLIRSGTPGKYISLESISDDELHRITRSLVTPVSFPYDLEHTATDGHPFPYHNEAHSSRQHIKTLAGKEHSDQTLTHRSESAAIFDLLNNDDELSVDFAASDLQDFIDPVLLEGVISRPVSRVPKYDSFSCEHDPSEKTYITPSSVESSMSSKFNLLPAVGYIRHNNDKELCAQTVDKYNQLTNIIMTGKDMKPHHIQSPAANNYSSINSKRHSMDAEVLMALRRDSDALLQRRESLLRLRKFSEGMASPDVMRGSTKSSNKNISSDPIALPTRSKHTLLLEKDKYYSKMDTRHDSIHDKRRADDRQNHKSVTESAKNLLADVRQRRADSRKEAYNRLCVFSRAVNNNRAPDTDRQRLTVSQAEIGIINSNPPGYYTERSTYSPKKIPDDKARVKSKQYSFSDQGEVPDSSRATGRNRRWSSSLPLSNSSFYDTQTNFGHPNEGAPKSIKLQQTGKKSYVAKKSALDKSKDRYVALLGNPPSSK